MRIVIVSVIEAYIFFNRLQDLIQSPHVKVDSICRWNYWVSSVWISTQQFNYW